MTVHRIWGAFGLQPHRVETFKLSSDPLFVVTRIALPGFIAAQTFFSQAVAMRRIPAHACLYPIEMT